MGRLIFNIAGYGEVPRQHQYIKWVIESGQLGHYWGSYNMAIICTPRLYEFFKQMYPLRG